ncbi:hypothetical protein NDN16_10325 [Aureimonas altamirensis]|uniref:hypothetical protein n=1 Tax=Aureimonas altamirensis TaxID=370622 RepID=UPI002036E3CE|nr:hypothetical protein [Aureimonas altamirensis]MCM2504069.1 hypothetical protein [Aureimonas altamirensis]
MNHKTQSFGTNPQVEDSSRLHLDEAAGTPEGKAYPAYFHGMGFAVGAVGPTGEG